MTVLLEAHDLTQTFGSGAERTVALEHLTLSITEETPSFTAIVGESGSGKTTLARSLLGFLRPTSGEVRYRGRNLYQMGGGGLLKFRREVQAIFQDPFEVYNPFYRIDHLLMTPIKKFHLASSGKEAREMVDRALRTVGLQPEETLGRFPHQLSGGQRQRVTVARALLIQPKLVIADEPVSMIDASLRATVLESLRRLFNDFGISFIYITHDLTTAYQVSDNVLVLYRGRIAEAGDVEHVIKQPEHPYTQLLVNSIPVADPDQKWGEDIPVVESGGMEADRSHACAFVSRCPKAMPRCAQEVPPLYRTLAHRGVACYLYDKTEETVEGDVTQVFNQSATPAHTEGAAAPGRLAVRR
ncbi:MAG: ABC transporter ATP-binding protein [Candidatus Dormibacteraeota bacterium]|nr:ABC transporter ATP-binding protein [Candidatus Dormibacteraeota bacterium]